MVLNAFTVAATGLANLTENFFAHYKRKTTESNSSSSIQSRRGFLFDQAFAAVSHFLSSASHNTVEELQRLGNGHIPSPPWVKVTRVIVPASTRQNAAKTLIKTLGENEVKNVLGGSEWWQRSDRELRGEWISMKRDWELSDSIQEGADIGDGDDGLDPASIDRLEKLEKERRHRRRSTKKETSKGEKGKNDEEEEEEEEKYSSEMDELPAMLYIHGGAYFFGSINTHRYSIWRYCRKTGGRAFGINYRLSPQYPFPCALADALASYLYLINPPPEAQHRAIDPARLTLAGDSAGGGLTLALLCLIRDSGLPLPAGAILISPWCDLTHSFPSIVENTATDVIPPYGFLFKPSTLWPPPSPEFDRHASDSIDMSSKSQRVERKNNRSFFRSSEKAKKKGEELASKVEATLGDDDPRKAEEGQKEEGRKTMTEPGSVLRVEVDGEEVEVRDQIQLYATNEQLAYPYVSPIWQPSLGGLCPLYILAGDSEVLRDEIIYMAHRAADPQKYPIRQGLLNANPERAKLAATYGPTQVHLQVYDDCCHDLPLFSFLTPAKYCYRAIASFILFVTAPTYPLSPRHTTNTSPSQSTDSDRLASGASTPATSVSRPSPAPRSDSLPVPSSRGHSKERSASVSASTAVDRSNSEPKPLHRTRSIGASLRRVLTFNASDLPPSPTIPRQLVGIERSIYSALQPLNRPSHVNNMIRERVGLNGDVRPLEAAEDMAALQLDNETLGMLKSAPIARYLAGKAIWAKRFAKAYEKVQKRREHHLKASHSEQAKRIKDRKKARSKSSPQKSEDTSSLDLEGVIYHLRGERPPPSSIASRKDTSEARKLASSLGEHYSKLHSLRLWGQVQTLGDFSTPPPNPSPHSSSESNPALNGKIIEHAVLVDEPQSI